MKKRNPFLVFLFSLITLGIYDLYWLVQTKKELNAKTKHHIPTIWLLVFPLVIIAAGVILLIVTGPHTTTTSNNFNYGYSYGPQSTTSTTSTTGVPVLSLALYLVGILLTIVISFYWFFKYSKAVNEYTSGKMNTGLTFILLWLLHLIGIALVQDAYNDVIDSGGPAGTATAAATPPAVPAQPFPPMNQPSPSDQPDPTPMPQPAVEPPAQEDHSSEQEPSDQPTPEDHDDSA